jgi:hypothetical protein
MPEPHNAVWRDCDRSLGMLHVKGADGRQAHANGAALLIVGAVAA